MLTVTVPGLRIVSVANRREHWTTRRRRVNDEKLAVAAALLSVPQRESEAVCVEHRGPLRVTLTRLGGQALDTDNLASGFKACRDQIARWLLRDDGPKSGVTWEYDQEPGGACGVRIEITAASA